MALQTVVPWSNQVKLNIKSAKLLQLIIVSWGMIIGAYDDE